MSSSFVNFGTGLGLAENIISFLIPRRSIRIGPPGLLKLDPLPKTVVELDASLEELHTASVDITRHPVEKGADITDHIRRKPRRIRITGIVTNTPIVLFAFARTSLGGRRAELFFEAIEEVMNSGTLVSVFTTLKQYDNMAIREITVPRNKDKGNVVEATITFEEVILVQTQTTLATNPVSAANKGTANAGKIAPPDAAPPAVAVKSQSALSKLASVGNTP